MPYCICCVVACFIHYCLCAECVKLIRDFLSTVNFAGTLGKIVSGISGPTLQRLCFLPSHKELGGGILNPVAEWFGHACDLF